MSEQNKPVIAGGWAVADEITAVDAGKTAITLLQQLAARGVVPAGVAEDSRQVRQGDLYLAYPGSHTDGRCYIDDAVARGASAVLWEDDGQFQWHVNPLPAEQNTRPQSGVAERRRQLPNAGQAGLQRFAGALAHALAAWPSRQLKLLAITGTNGKTTCSQWLGQIFPGRCAVIGTLGAGFVNALDATGFTTPQASTLARCLKAFADDGATACALEASSIGIAEGRLNGAEIDVAVLTNFTRDHLDYHGTMAAYAAAKSLLFRWPGLRAAVINADDPLGNRLLQQKMAATRIAYSLENNVVTESSGEPCRWLYGRNFVSTATGLHFSLEFEGQALPLHSGLIGRHNAANLLAVAGVLLLSGIDFARLPALLTSLQPPPGRMQRLGGAAGQPLVVVDFAHTPDALEQALKALREVAQARGGKLHCIFGCGGDRDRGKRPLMGAVAQRLADQVTLTSDNPRDEDPVEIIEAIRVGVPDARVCVDRAAAIAAAITEASPEDVLLLAGKGHETSQEVAGHFHPFSDLTVASACLASLQERARA